MGVGRHRPVVVPPPSAVDSIGPRISRVAPTWTVTDRTPTIRATVPYRDSRVRARSLVMRVDGRRVTGRRWDSARGLVRWTPGRRLAPGRHVVRLVAADAVGNRTVRTWRFTVLP